MKRRVLITGGAGFIGLNLISIYRIGTISTLSFSTISFAASKKVHR